MSTSDNIALVERLSELNRRLLSIHDLDTLCQEVQELSLIHI